ncbi:transcriptional regulator, LacI family [Arthrobacter sp. yr096]|uniref:LacI family DNA-binding transcriptional regulator n=1 Tax=Arthrobacter sp. yr096 TaxID=1761750 RepID=UPI0008CE1F25|nr:LacI family DNA-binding transcriptional regulator [Arthrobacter sp. yr096]SEJ62816.1 transcriptional regulator, LacI family [Arthrobacter sp. yr096]
MATLREVAELAAVSVATASRVLNGSAHPVSRDIRESVQSAAKTLGYTPSAAAQALKQQRSKIIGVIASDILDPYFAELTRGIEIEAAKAGFVTILANANRDPEQERTKFRVLREHQASGIVFCGSDIEGSPGTAELAREVNLAVRAGTRVVALAPRGFDSTKIVIDNHAASYALTRYMLSLGHRRIAFIGGMPGLTAVEQRVVGYRRAMFEAQALPMVLGSVGMRQESGRDAVAQLIGAGELPEAIVCANDEIAVGVLAGLWTSGYRIPDDVSVAGIGGTRGGAVFGLTTVTLPLVELGGMAAAYIADAGRSPKVPEAPQFELRPGSTTAVKDPSGSSRGYGRGTF